MLSLQRSLLQESYIVRNVTTSQAGRWQHHTHQRPAGLPMGEQQHGIDALIAEAQAGDETARDELLVIIEEMLAEGIGLPAPGQG